MDLCCTKKSSTLRDFAYALVDPRLTVLVLQIRSIMDAFPVHFQTLNIYNDA